MTDHGVYNYDVVLLEEDKNLPVTLRYVNNDPNAPCHGKTRQTTMEVCFKSKYLVTTHFSEFNMLQKIKDNYNLKKEIEELKANGLPTAEKSAKLLDENSLIIDVNLGHYKAFDICIDYMEYLVKDNIPDFVSTMDKGEINPPELSDYEKSLCDFKNLFRNDMTVTAHLLNASNYLSLDRLMHVIAYSIGVFSADDTYTDEDLRNMLNVPDDIPEDKKIEIAKEIEFIK